MSALFKHRGIQILLLVAAYLFLADFLPPLIHQGFYTISVLIKDLLMWILPITVGFFIAHTISSFKNRALVFVFTLIAFETLSNLCCVWYAYFTGHLAADYLPAFQVHVSQTDFDALWRLPIPKPAWWSADKGSLLGLMLGTIAALSKKPLFKHFIERGKEWAQFVLTRVFSRVIALFVLGFVARMHQTKVLHQTLNHYGILLIWLIVFLIIYLIALFLIGSGSLKAIKNLLPAGGIAFTSGCSNSTMPWTIEGTAKNLQNPGLAKAVIPATTNIQQVGDCIINTFLCFLIYRHFFGHNPDLITWVNFSIVFVLARFATAAVIGGAIFIMLPIYESYLSFNAEMIAIILAFNVILDPIVTSCNVIANGALCRIFEKVWILIVGADEKVT